MQYHSKPMSALHNKKIENGWPNLPNKSISFLSGMLPVVIPQESVHKKVNEGRREE